MSDYLEGVIKGGKKIIKEMMAQLIVAQGGQLGIMVLQHQLHSWLLSSGKLITLNF